MDQADPAAQPLPFPLHIPFVQALGVELWAFADGMAELRMSLQPSHHNSWQVAHGGVLMTLLDVAMAHAARSPKTTPGVPLDAGVAAALQSPGVVTIEMKTSFLRPGEGRLRVTGKLLHRTATLAFTEGSVYSASGELCAQASGTFKFLRALPAADRQAKTVQPSAAEQAATAYSQPWYPPAQPS
jgi:uncharacterized protein (TIGR00369 family)